jgi:pimeloyl-ACP methyl ester carboxylesterase
VCAEFGALDDAYWRHLAQHGVKAGEDGRFSLRYDPAISRGLPPHLDPELPIGPEFLRGIDLWKVWDSVHCPVLVLRGEHSHVLPEDVLHEMRRRKPDIHVADIPGVGHVPALASDFQIEVVRKFLLAEDMEVSTAGTEASRELSQSLG